MTDIERMALDIVDQERVQNEDALVWVTDQVAFRMREMIKTFRKNYWGVFDQPYDSQTGRKKTWVHLAMTLVEDVVKNEDMDQKDINFRAKHPKGYDFTEVARGIVRDYLDNIYFSETLDETNRQQKIDGTAVWKTWELNNQMQLTQVDLLNFYIDPSAENIQKAYRVTERALMTPGAIEAMDGWMNNKRVKGTRGLHPTDANMAAVEADSTESVDVWEMWGKIPLYLITGKKTDKDKEVDGHIVVCGLEGEDKRVLLIEKNTNKDRFGNIIKPYEEYRTAKIAGRWYGVGIVERVMALQEWLNSTANIRKNRNYISQMGLFKVVKGRGITAQMLQKLPKMGSIPVTAPDDVTQFNVQPVDASAYKDEEVVWNYARQVSQALPISAGSELPASQTATGSAIQNTNAQKSSVMNKEAYGSFLKRWMNRHAMHRIMKNAKIGDYVRFSGDDDKFNDLVDRAAAYLVRERLDESYKRGVVPSEGEVIVAIDKAKEDMRSRPELFVEVMEDIALDQIDTHVYFTNEDLDTTVTVQNLITMMGIDEAARGHHRSQIYDLLGLQQPRVQDLQTPSEQVLQGVPPQPTLQTATTNAVTPQLNG